MIQPVRNAKDFWAGALYILIGAAAIFLPREYGMGTATKMGPAYFPVVLGGLLALIGAASIIRSFFRKGEPIERFALKGMVLVCVGTALFGLLLHGAGLVVSIVVLVLVSSYASIRFQIVPSVLIALGLAIVCAAAFIKGLGIPMSLFGSWFGG